MKLELLCSLDIEYLGDFHQAQPYCKQGGPGWGIGKGAMTGDRLAGNAQWSNHPMQRGDGAMLPNLRGVVGTHDGGEVIFELSGRTVWFDRDGQRVGRQLLMMLLESADDRYAWLNNTVRICEGALDPANGTAHIKVYTCTSEL
jgi:hypothetical protein